MQNENKIDAVYTWVDGEDCHWQEEFQSAVHKLARSGSAIHQCRFRDLGEIFYSLLSLEKFAPWINHIFIVKKPYQFPSIAALPAPIKNKIIWVDDAKLKPPELSLNEFYPTFNSLALEANLHRIPGLSEQFIYFNNDMFLGNNLQPDYFFSQGKLRFAIEQEKQYSSLKIIRMFIRRMKRGFITGHFRHIHNTYLLFQTVTHSLHQLGMKFSNILIHQCCPMYKSSYEFIWSQVGVKPDLLRTSASKFRSDANIHPVFLVCLISLLLNKAWLVREKSAFVQLGKKNLHKDLQRLIIERPARFCINDRPQNKNLVETKQIFADFMQNYFNFNHRN